MIDAIPEPDKQDQGLRILFVPRWYPNRCDPMPGLFIQRQAEALAKRHSVQVISVHQDPSCLTAYELVHSVENTVKTCRVYYRTGSKLPVLSKLVNFFRYIKAHHLGYTSLEPFKVDIIHGHILTREIFFAWFMSRKQKQPYLISEHWSRYFPENGTYKGLIRKWLTESLLKKSSGLIVVSDSLAEAMKSSGLVHPNTFVVPNVADSSAFLPPQNKPVVKQAVILHVSCFDDKSKNISGFLEAIAELALRRNDFKVVLAGEGPDHMAMRDYALRLGLNEQSVVFTGLVQNAELLGLYQSSSFLVQTSRYETFGTVVIEALCCGLPVVSTNTGVAAAVINESNGIIIRKPNTPEIVMAIEKMLNNYFTFEGNKIHKTVAHMFSDEMICGKLTAIYDEIKTQCLKD